MNKRRLRALLVDDSETSLALVSKILAALETDSSTALNGKLGLELFAAHPNSFDIVFLDINMPELNGIELAKKIRELDTKIPIVAFTANATQENNGLSKSAGIALYLSKFTINKKLLAAILGTYCGYTTSDGACSTE